MVGNCAATVYCCGKVVFQGAWCGIAGLCGHPHGSRHTRFSEGPLRGHRRCPRLHHQARGWVLVFQADRDHRRKVRRVLLPRLPAQGEILQDILLQAHPVCSEGNHDSKSGGKVCFLKSVCHKRRSEKKNGRRHLDILC